MIVAALASCGAAAPAPAARTTPVRDGVYVGSARWPHGEGRIHLAVWRRRVQRWGEARAWYRCYRAGRDDPRPPPPRRWYRAPQWLQLPWALVRRDGSFGRTGRARTPAYWNPPVRLSGRFDGSGASGSISRHRHLRTFTDSGGDFEACDSFGGARWRARRVRTPWRDGRYRGTISLELPDGRSVRRPFSILISRGRASDARFSGTCAGPPPGEDEFAARISRFAGVQLGRRRGRLAGSFELSAHVPGAPRGTDYVLATVRGTTLTGSGGTNHLRGATWCQGHGSIAARWSPR